MKKILAVLLSAVLVLGLFAACGDDAGTTPTTETTPAETYQTVEELYILYTNDVHNAYQMQSADPEKPEEAYTMGYAALAEYANTLRQEGKEVVIIDGGDHLQGEAVGTLSKGSYLVDLMNAVGYNFAVPGNHEFDYGMDTFLNIANEQAEYTYISCNFLDLENGYPVFAPYAMVEVGNVTVAFVGISTPETFTKSTPAYFQNENGEYIYGFAEGEDGEELYHCVQNAIDQAYGEGANYVIAVGHLGIDPESSPWTSYEVIANTTGLTAFLDAHSHSVVEYNFIASNGLEDTMLHSSGTKLNNIGQVVLNLVDGTVTGSLVSGLTAEDATVKELADKVSGQFEDLLNEVVAVSQVDLITQNPEDAEDRIIREQETNLGDLCADAYRSLLGADVAFVNGGGIRAEIKTGDVTYEDIIAVHPFGNAACLVEATGQEILDALEMAYSQVGLGENGGFLHVSGMTLEIDTSIGSTVTLDDKGAFTGITGERRVKNVLIGGEAIDPEKTYTVASHNYMLKSGGDGFTMFMDNTVLQNEVMIDNQVLINYIQQTLGGVIPATLYGNPNGEGRIVIIAQ